MNTYQSRVGIALTVATACLFSFSTATHALTYSEPADLSNSIGTPTPLGPVSLGVNTVDGSVSGSALFNPVTLEVDWTGDFLDAFEYVVPGGLSVSGIEVLISNFASTAFSVFGEVANTSGGVDTPFWSADTTYPNILTGGTPLGSGTHNLGLQIADTCPGCSGGETLSYDWTVNITVVPEPSSMMLLATAGIVSFYTCRRKRR